MRYRATAKTINERGGLASEWTKAEMYMCGSYHVFTPEEKVVIRELNGSVIDAYCPIDGTRLATMTREFADEHYSLTEM